MGECSSICAVRWTDPRDVLAAVEAYLDQAGIAHAPWYDAGGGPAAVEVCDASGGWITVRWPDYFAPRDVAACLAISDTLHTVVSAVTTTDDEGWSHTLLACGTLLDRHHSFPAAFAWDGDDVAALAAEWSGDHVLVARVLGVPACEVRRHFCQATASTRDHPGRERLGYVGLWRALGIRVAEGPSYAALAVDASWHRLPA